ncbi:MAG: metallophosphoesterase [Arachnia sp.]
MNDRRRFSALLSTLALTATGLFAGLGAAPAQAASTCDVLTAPVYSTTNPKLETNLLTTSSVEHQRSQEVYGFTADPHVVGLAARKQESGLVKVTRLYNVKTHDFMWAAGAAEVSRMTSRGFRVEGSEFYAATSAESCTVAVYRYAKGSHFAFASSADERRKLTTDGWVDEGAVFHLRREVLLPKPDSPTSIRDISSGTFTLAVIPDTQEEVNKATDTRSIGRTQWLVDNKAKLGLKYVLHTGDIVNWGDVDPKQYDIAQKSLVPLAQAGIPYSLAIGNHDTPAVGHDGKAGSRGYGGSAYVNNPECKEKFGAEKCKTWLLIRDTKVFNERFPLSSLSDVGGTFEPGKVDNMWTTFRADGADWLVLTLEFHARKEAIEWARGVVASHPTHNVIIQTHSYLTSSGSIYTTASGYGSTTGTYLFDNLIKVYPNIKLVFSGHVGNAAKRVDTGVNGNKIVSYLGCFHSRTTNPMRLVTIDADTGLVTTKVYAPATNATTAAWATSDTISVIKTPSS